MKNTGCLCLLLLFTHQVSAQLIRAVSSKQLVTYVAARQALVSQFSAYTIVSVDVDTTVYTQPPRFLLQEENATVEVALAASTLLRAGYSSKRTTAQGEQLQGLTRVRRLKGYTPDGEPVRLSIYGQCVTGYFVQDGRMRFIEPLQRYWPAATPSQCVIYEAKDVLHGPVMCGPPQERISDTYVATRFRRADAVADSAEPVRNVEISIATEADYTYFKQYKEQTNDHILDVIHQVEGLYEKDFGIHFAVTYQHVYETDTDPYTSTDARTLLQQFQSWWNAAHQDVPRNYAFLFNYVSIPTGVLGRAYQAQACEGGSSGYGFFSYASPLYESIIVAHEMGHLFGAEHEPAGVCNVQPTLMCASVFSDAPFEFSREARKTIADYVQSHTCLRVPLAVKVHPVPAHTEVVFESPVPDFVVTLFDTLGKRVAERTYAENYGALAVDHLQEGIYIATIQAGSQTVTRRIVVVQSGR